MQLLCHKSLCSDPRDKIYAIVSLAGKCKDSLLSPDYSKSVFQVYEDVMWFMEHKAVYAGGKRRRGDPFGIQISETFLRYIFSGLTTQELDKLAFQHFRSKTLSQDYFQVEGYSQSSILAVGPPLLTIMVDYESARQWIHSIRERPFEGKFNECAEFQALTLLNSIEKPIEAGVSALEAIAFSSPKAYMLEAAPYMSEARNEGRKRHNPEIQPDHNQQESDERRFQITANNELRLFLADDGYIGIGAGTIEKGDLVCTFSGGRVVAIARMQEDRGGIICRGIIDFSFDPGKWLHRPPPCLKLSTWDFFLDIETLYFLTR